MIKIERKSKSCIKVEIGGNGYVIKDEFAALMDAVVSHEDLHILFEEALTEAMER